jgi:hypothetical protein
MAHAAATTCESRQHFERSWPTTSSASGKADAKAEEPVREEEMRGILAGLAIGLGVLLISVSVVVSVVEADGFGWGPVVQFIVGGLTILLGFYLRYPKRVPPRV